jgi:Domain of unknown function (DUF5753)
MGPPVPGETLEEDEVPPPHAIAAMRQSASGRGPRAGRASRRGGSGLYDDTRRFRFLIDEGALRAGVAPPSVMRGQLDRLLTLSAALHHVELRVLSVRPAPLHGWTLTSFDIVDDEYVWLST